MDLKHVISIGLVAWVLVVILTVLSTGLVWPQTGTEELRLHVVHAELDKDLSATARRLP